MRKVLTPCCLVSKMTGKMSKDSDCANVSSPGSICIECGRKNSRQLYKEFTCGTIQLSQCPTCEKIIDKYVEFDAVILLLDVLLLRIQSYRHLIFNYGIQSSILWKFSTVLVLCEAYTKLRLLKLATSDSILLQIQFHGLLLQSIIEFLCLLACAFSLIQIFVTTRATWFDVYRTVVISSFGRLSAVAAMVWTGSDLALWLPTVLVLPAQFQAFRALLGISVPRAAAIVSAQTILLWALSSVLADWRVLALQQMGIITLTSAGL